MRQCAAYVTAVTVSVLGLGMLFTVSRHETRVLADVPASPAAAPTISSAPISVRNARAEVILSLSERDRPPAEVRTGRVNRRARIIDDFQPDLVKFPAQTIANSDPLTQNTADLAAPDFVAPKVVSATQRVTLVLLPDHTIRIESANGTSALLKDLPAASVMITAESFQLIPSLEPGSGNQVSCIGSVQIRGPQFTAGGTQLLMQGGNLLLEGTEEIPAYLTKAGTVTTPVSETIAPRTAPPVEPSVTPNFDDIAPRPVTRTASPPAAPPAAVAPKSVPPEFRITAQRISFTLALDQIKVGDQAVIAPPAPGAPATLEPRVPSATPPTPRAPRDSNVPERGTLPMPPQLPEDGVQKPEVPKVS